MNIELAIERLLDFYNIKTITELAEELSTTQSTISGWKSRQAFGALIEKVLHINENALYYIFDNKNINNNIEKYIPEDLIINSIKFRILEKVQNEFFNFQQEIFLLHKSINEIRNFTLNNREDLVKIVKAYNIRLIIDTFQHAITEKNRNNCISFIYSFDEVEIDFICKNTTNFKNILWSNLNWANKIFTTNKKD